MCEHVIILRLAYRGGRRSVHRRRRQMRTCALVTSLSLTRSIVARLHICSLVHRQSRSVTAAQQARGRSPLGPSWACTRVAQRCVASRTRQWHGCSFREEMESSADTTVDAWLFPWPCVYTLLSRSGFARDCSSCVWAQGLHNKLIHMRVAETWRGQRAASSCPADANLILTCRCR